MAHSQDRAKAGLVQSAIGVAKVAPDVRVGADINLCKHQWPFHPKHIKPTTSNKSTHRYTKLANSLQNGNHRGKQSLRSLQAPTHARHQGHHRSARSIRRLQRANRPRGRLRQHLHGKQTLPSPTLPLSPNQHLRTDRRGHMCLQTRPSRPWPRNPQRHAQPRRNDGQS